MQLGVIPERDSPVFKVRAAAVELARSGAEPAARRQSRYLDWRALAAASAGASRDPEAS